MDRDTSMLTCRKCGHVMTSDFTLPSSPVPDLLRTVHAVPYKEEEKVIRNTICETEHDMLLLNQEISQVEALLAALHRKHVALANHLQTHRSLLAPVRKLPAEIVSEIFALCLPINDDGGYSYRRAVMLPGQICRSWRDIACSSSKLWSSISLRLNRWLKPESLLLAMTWLRRSSGYPLSLRISGVRTRHGELHSLLSLMVAYSNCWKHVEFDIGLCQYRPMHTAKEYLARLETLVLRDTRNSPGVVTTFERAPQLRSVDLHVDARKVKLPWNQLTDLSMSGSPLQVILEILTTSFNLLTCAFTVHEYLSTQALSLTEHTCLQSLRIDVVASDIPILDYLHLPALERLQYAHGSSPSAPSQILSLLARSSCPLRTLIITSPGWPLWDDLIRILELSPMLRKLELRYLSDFVDFDKVLRRLTYNVLNRVDNVPLVPELETLKVTPAEFSTSCRFTYSILADMIESRCRLINPSDSKICVARIQTVHIYVDDYFANIDPITLARFLGFKDQGLDIEIMVNEGRTMIV